MTEPYVKAYLNPDTGKMEYKSVGSPVKALDGNRVSGYLVRFTSADDTDLHGEYFDKSTNFWLKEHSPIGKPIMIDHAFDAKFKSVPVGIIDFAKEDEIGIWIEGKLKERAEYEDMLRGWKDRKYINIDNTIITKAASGIEQAVKTFFSTGKAQWSSGALPQSVEIDETTKHIKSWAFIEGTGVMTPAEPDGTEIKLKSVFSTLDEILNSQLTDSPTGHKEPIAAKDGTGASTDNEAAQPNVHIVKTPTPVKGQSKMENEEETQKVDGNPAEVLTGIAEQLIALAQSMGMPEGEAVAMAKEVVEEEAKAEGDTPEEDPEEKAEKMVKRLIKKHEANKAKVQKFANKGQALVNDYLKRQPATSPLPAYTGGGNGHNGQAPRITVGESQKYAHLSAEEMGLAFKVLESAYHPTQRKRLTLGQMVEDGYVSPEFVKTWQHKAARTVDAFKFRDDALGRQSESTLKSIRFLKADELNSSDITGQGSELPGVFYDNTMWERARERTELFNMLVSRGLVTKDIPQGAETVEFKIDTSSPTVFTRHQARSLDATGRSEVTARITPLGTDNLQATPAEHVLATSTTDILTEDSVINLVNYLNQDIQRTLAESLEDALINGDSETAANTNVNLIDGTPETGLSRPLYIAWDGFRKHALVTHSGQANNEGAALSIDTYFDTVAEFDDNAIESRTNELVFIVDKDTHRASRKLPELLTPGVAMQGATIYVGQMPDIDGVAIYRSGFLSKSNTAGKISATAGNNTKGQVVCVYPYYWGYGRKRAITIENDRDIMAGVTVFVASVRHVLVARSAKAATISYNVTV